MSIEAERRPLTTFEQFRMEVLRNPTLQRKLIGLESNAEFVTRVVDAGAELGFEFTAGDVEEAMRAGHAEWILRWM